ncbi:MAG: hypothetical protein AB7R55_09860 [Gemmatimonadales bacterium]
MRGSTAVFVALAAMGVGLQKQAVAQTPEQRADSLARELSRLKTRIDSLERVVRLLAPAARDTARAVDELAALRAAAAAAAPADSAAAEAPTTFVSRTRSQPQLNPEISATGDVRFVVTDPGPQENNFQVREFEFSIQAPLDPFSNTKIFLGWEEGHLDLEEGYGYWTGLPGHLRLDVGRFRQQIGELNRWHLHALPESEYPLVLREYLGEEGLVGDGLSLYWLAPATAKALGTHEFHAQVTLANNETLFESGTRLSYLGHFLNFWQLSPSTFLQVGATGLYGKNPDADLSSTVFGGEFRLTWRPPARANYRSFTLRGEGYRVKQTVEDVGEPRYGGFLGARFQVNQRLHLGTRFDWVEPLSGGGDHIWAIVPSLTWWQSEWVYLHAEWEHQSNPDLLGRLANNRFSIRAVWSVGPHKHESY